MKLKSLEIKGFKSFADKTQIILDNPITGIVGPNGCGKSNIIDAIRWVIGEHKIKALRSDNLEDLIFNGSRSRATSGMAEVSLTFENTRNLLPTEFTTVTITRKFYRSGESEYRLNDVACRLKDIHNLFLDTGVSNDSYAIIELGMVDDIIKDKEGSRRRMLEQAAGISIYKTRKKEAKSKLEATQLDVDRIEDLLFEITNNLRTLENQAKKAERYYQIKNEYKEVSVELAKASLEAFNGQYQSLNDQLEKESDRKLQIDASLAGDEAEIEANKVKLTQQEHELHGLQKRFNDLLAGIRQLEGDKKLAAQRLDHLQDREKSLNEFLSGADAQVAQLRESIQFTENHLQEEQDGLEDLKDQLETLRDSLDDKRDAFDEKKKVLEAHRHTFQQNQRRQFDAEKIVAVADTSVVNLQRSLQQLMDDKTQRHTQLQAIQTEKKQLEEQLIDQQGALQELIAKQEEVKERILHNQEALEQLRVQSVAENRKLDAKRNEHDLLQSLVNSLEGYPESIKFLNKNKAWGSKAPILSDVFLVNEPYRLALENVLDSYLNYYVVTDVAEAQKAISLLDEHQKGKASFFILDALKVVEKPLDFAAEGLVKALEVVTVDKPYQALAAHLLSNVYVAEETVDIATIEVPQGIVLINKKGNILKGTYTLSGGSVGKFEGNKIGRAKNLERLENEIETLRQSTESLKAAIDQKKLEISGYNETLNDKAIDQSKVAINQLQNQVYSLNNKAEHLEQLDQNSISRIQDIEEQLADTRGNVSDKQEELDEINEHLQKLLDQIKVAETDFQMVEADFNMASQQYNNQNLQYTRQQSKIENLRQEYNFKSNQVKDLEVQVTNNRGQLKETAQQISDTSGKLHFGDNELYDLLKQKETDEKSLSEKDRLYYALRNSISEHESRISRQRRERDNADTLLSSIKEKLNEMKLQLAGMKERLHVEFKVDLDEVLEQARANELTVEELNAEAEKLKKRLDNIGEINPTAIEAYQEMKVRHDFIMDQKGDLEEARNTLLATIEEVENTANARFKETFDKVRENFVHVFKALFTEEDNADLRLTDENNLADSGIEIYAQPKGKRPSTLTQLSGGEKTLTSTAFLFAIYLIKPAPFCILDEVDAPLDDANVGKFTQMIRKFSDNSQFIIVTHNKQTMSAVDVIYGVTMQEAGVSKLVPVDFRSLN
ncbi:chromosome segregation protein SMC [Taibaiella sp. KBW10]|uniref:chromosome segregation protein SMC n=1 Tax=Taibaiella sp. KBW10 TaxID=2153357 RepID=UPI000F595F01|nr:chromosome segregation protein SMC [Taibaiella sp. KBW10]RQO31715.1 chromosome segregation protein SMC [Taibaiella sp. KBW10]